MLPFASAFVVPFGCSTFLCGATARANAQVHEAEARQKARQDTLKAMNEAETARKPPVSQLFEDVYDKLPHHLQDQKREWSEHLAKHGGRYHLGEYLDDKDYQDPGKQH